MNGTTKWDLTNVLKIVTVMVKESVPKMDGVMVMLDLKITHVPTSQVKVVVSNMITLVTKNVMLLLSIVNVTMKV
jgi:hypothetical protein